MSVIRLPKLSSLNGQKPSNDRGRRDRISELERIDSLDDNECLTLLERKLGKTPDHVMRSDEGLVVKDPENSSELILVRDRLRQILEAELHELD